MAGIYIHIPFCKNKCHYCNFYSVASSRHVSDFGPALLREIELQRDYLESETVETIYLGGGTPSLLDYDVLAQILDKLQQTYEISSEAEITIEANPDDLDQKKLNDLRLSRFNHLSIGIQSFFEEDLKYLNRKHTASQAEASVKRSQDAGFENISIDLIYGIPTLTDDNWKRNLDIAFSLDVPHISAYGLTVEPKTALDTLIKKGRSKAVDEEQSVRQFKMLMQQMKDYNFLHYEISNFCKEGNISKHNSNYWKGRKYLGLGPSAHSYDIGSRQWNAPDIISYLSSLEKGKVPFEKETLTDADKFNEYVMTSLRTKWGCDLNYVEMIFGNDAKVSMNNKAIKFMEKGEMLLHENTLFLTDEGKLFADGIASEFFMTGK
jgi:oxygen-independent coproporphyrinogen III oxidase